MSFYSTQFVDPSHPFPRLGPFHGFWLAVMALACALASIHPLDFPSYLMHQASTLVGVGAMVWLARDGKISPAGFALGSLFMLVHILGAHYLYSNVPYNDWSKALLNWDLNAHFGWKRNMYDRLVHFCYGLLLYKLFLDVFSSWFPQVNRGRVALLVLQWILASSTIYELIEWWIAIGMSPEKAEQYNGQQGDVWDAHKDMALAFLGGLIAWIVGRLLPSRHTPLSH